MTHRTKAMRAFRILTASGTSSEVPLQDAGRPGALVWVHAEMDDSLEELAAIGLDEFEPSDLARVIHHGIQADAESPGASDATRRSGNRFVAAPFINVVAQPDTTGRPALYSAQVSILATARGLLTASSSAWQVRASEAAGPPVDIDELIAEALRRWRPDYSDGADLGVLVLRAVADSYLPSLLTLRRRLQVVEQAFVEGQDDPHNVTTLDFTGYRLQVADIKWAVDALSLWLPPLLRHGETAPHAWFDIYRATDEAKGLQSLLRQVDHELSGLRDTVRASFALAASSQAAQQLEQTTEVLRLTRAGQQAEHVRAADAREGQARLERLQRIVTTASAVLLVPSLIAGVWGAFPSIFHDCQELRFASMFAAMVTFGLATYFGLRRLGTGPKA